MKMGIVREDAKQKIFKTSIFYGSYFLLIVRTERATHLKHCSLIHHSSQDILTIDTAMSPYIFQKNIHVNRTQLPWLWPAQDAAELTGGFVVEFGRFL